ncbi:hypothetical protein ACFYQA_08605 [Streptomyces sp. NPDC005774]|uniref:hypothetical protein n=1 Tax=Streptomyces sp. NPDC005774 TaxID=3364728 RepID=UPI00367EFF7F
MALPGSGASRDAYGPLERRVAVEAAKEPDTFRRKVAEVADAQQRGDLALEIQPDGLLTMVLAMGPGVVPGRRRPRPGLFGVGRAPGRRGRHRRHRTLLRPASGAGADAARHPVRRYRVGGARAGTAPCPRGRERGFRRAPGLSSCRD